MADELYFLSGFLREKTGMFFGSTLHGITSELAKYRKDIS